MQRETSSSSFHAEKSRAEFESLPHPKSLQDVAAFPCKIDDIAAGQKDLAELRADETGTYYSNFTPQGYSPPKCLRGNPMLMAAWTKVTFMVLAAHALVFSLDTMVMTLIGVGATLLCSQSILNWRFGMERSAVFVGIIFPLVFLIGQTWGRREQASACIAGIRANGAQLILKVMGKDPQKAHEAKKHVEELLKQIGHYMPQDSCGSRTRLANIYGVFSHLNDFNEEILVRFIVCDFEKLRQLRNYRTPWALNYFCFLFGNLAPVFLAPMFATVGCLDKSPARSSENVDCGYGTPGAYISMAFFTILLSSLLGVVKALEDPFALNGPDDVMCSFFVEGGALRDLIEDRIAHSKRGPASTAKDGGGWKSAEDAADHNDDDDGVAMV